MGYVANRMLIGVANISIGVLLFVCQDFMRTSALYVLALLLLLKGMGNLIGWATKKPRIMRKMMLPLFTLAFGAAFLFYHVLPFAILTVLFAGYLLLCGIIKTVDAFLLFRQRLPEGWLSTASAVFYLTFGVVLVIMPSHHIPATLYCIGVYCILLGVTYLADGVHGAIPPTAKGKLRRRVRITLPIFLAMFLPYGMQKRINDFLASGKEPPDWYGEERKDHQPPDLEVFIHVASRGFNRIGHCDLCFDGEVIAYGNYDEKHSVPFGLGPGVLILSQKEEYIPFCLRFNKTTIFCFGLRLTENQKERVRQRVRAIKELLVPWDPPYQAARKKGKTASLAEYRDFSSHLGYNTKAEFFKFKSGKFKTYFVMTTNCVLLAESIVCQAGTDILNLTGIISPGTFYDYLDREFLRPGSMVISREAYRLNGGQIQILHGSFHS